MSQTMQASSPVTRMQMLTTALVVLFLLISLGLGKTWLGADRAQQRSTDLLRQMDTLVTSRAADSSVGLMVSTAKLLPQIELLGLDPHRLAGSLDELQRAWLAGAQDSAARAELVTALVRARASVNSASLDRAKANRQRLQQLISLLAASLLAALATAGLLYRQRLAGEALALLGTNADGAWARDEMDRFLFQHVPLPIVYSDAQEQIVAVNDAYERMTGYSEEECLGKPLKFNLSGQQDRNFLSTVDQSLSAQGSWSGELWLRHKDGQAYADKITRVSVVDQEQGALGHVTLSLDSTSSDAASRLMLWQAHHDPLTKLPNRNLLEERLSRALLNPARGGALLSVDLDRFKDLNDSAGATKGDQVLIDAAYRLAMQVDESDTVARVAADHFVLLLEDVDDSSQIERMANNIVSAFQEPFMLSDQPLFSSASVGVVRYPRDGEEVGELLQRADAAQAQVKAQGGAGVAYYEPDLNSRAVRRLEIETALREAIDSKALNLHVQPILELEQSRVIGGEALLRWEHDSLGFVSPVEFVPIAESTGLIGALGLWVVEEAGRIQASWAAAGLGDLSLNINVSAAQIREANDIERFFAALDHTNRSLLTIELTETALVENRARAAEFLAALRERGCKVALDDFGTGFSSLSYLRDFHFDVLKIDRSFISNLSHSRDKGLVASMLSMGKIMGMKGVAEGVETLEQQQQLQAMGCTHTQGYFFARPMAQEDFIEFVQSHRASPQPASAGATG